MWRDLIKHIFRVEPSADVERDHFFCNVFAFVENLHFLIGLVTDVHDSFGFFWILFGSFEFF